MTRHTVLLTALTLLVSQTPAMARSVAPARNPADTSFARVEYWQCPDEGQAAFEQLIDSVWAPLFDQMVKEGKFTAWSAMAPVDAREVRFANGQTTLEPSTPAWNWVVTWHAVSRAALEEAWPEYHRRLEAAHPGRPGPDTFCTRVRIVSQRVLR
jgi:hypothetical protein